MTEMNFIQFIHILSNCCILCPSFSIFFVNNEFFNNVMRTHPYLATIYLYNKQVDEQEYQTSENCKNKLLLVSIRQTNEIELICECKKSLRR